MPWAAASGVSWTGRARPVQSSDRTACGRTGTSAPSVRSSHVGPERRPGRCSRLRCATAGHRAHRWSRPASRSTPLNDSAPPRVAAGRHARTRGDGGRRAGLAAEAAVAVGVVAQRPQEVDLAEVRPVGLAEVELAVRALPEQEAGQPLLAATCGSPGRGRAGPWCRGARRCARRRGPRPAPRARCPCRPARASSERTASAISRRPP